MNPHRGRQPAPRDHAQSRAHQLDRGHQRKCDQCGPQGSISIGCASNGICRDSRRIVVGRPSDQPWSQTRKRPLQKPRSFTRFDILVRQILSRCCSGDLHYSSLALRAPRPLQARQYHAAMCLKMLRGEEILGPEQPLPHRLGKSAQRVGDVSSLES